MAREHDERQHEVRALLAEMTLPGEIDIIFRGESEERDRSFESLFNAFWLAAALIYIVIAVQFNSLRQPLIVLCTVPLSLIGVAIGTYSSVAIAAPIVLVGSKKDGG